MVGAHARAASEAERVLDRSMMARVGGMCWKYRKDEPTYLDIYIFS
jgi:hypothetical protein